MPPIAADLSMRKPCKRSGKGDVGRWRYPERLFIVLVEGDSDPIVKLVGLLILCERCSPKTQETERILILTNSFEGDTTRPPGMIQDRHVFHPLIMGKKRTIERGPGGRQDGNSARDGEKGVSWRKGGRPHVDHFEGRSGEHPYHGRCH